MATTIGQHPVATFTSPVNGTSPIDANSVRGNDNTLRSAYVDHDADPGIHVQSSTLAARPAAGSAGRKWITADTNSYKLWYDDGTLWNEVKGDGLSTYVRATENIAKGDIVKTTGWSSVSGVPEIAKVASATDVAYGIAEAAINSGALGYVLTEGEISDLNTSAFSLGAVLYPNTSGGLTATKPTSGSYQPIAYVLRSDTTNGILYFQFDAPRIVEASTNTASTVVRRDASGNFSAGTVTAALTGNASTATALSSSRTFALTGDITGSVSSDLTSGASITTTIAAGVIVNADINASAAIADTKLDTISTAGKVSNSATTATSANTASAIVARDASGNFTAGTITAALSGNATTATTADKVANALTAGTYLTSGGTFDGAAARTFAVDATSANTASKVVARDSSGNFSAGTITAALTGNASTATALQTARTINGTSFDGTGNITITAANPNALTLGTYLTGTSYDGSGAVTTAVDATTASTASKVVARDSNGAIAAKSVALDGSSSGTVTVQPAAAAGTWTATLPTGAGSNGQVLTTDGSGTLSWTTVSGGGGTTTNALTAGSYLTGGTFNGSTAVTFAVDATSTNTASKVVARDGSGNFAAGTITAALSGNASTATALQTARTINGTSFDGTANITVTADANTLTGTTLASGVTASSLTSVGTLSSLAVTGDLTVDTSTLKVDSGNNRVGIATATPGYPLDVVGNANLSTGSAYKINGTDVLSGTTLGSGVTASSLTSVGTLTSATVSGDLTVDTSTLKVDSTNNRVGIVTASPSHPLHVVGTSYLQQVIERATVSATAATGTINYDALTQAVLFYTSNASANWTLNLRGSSTVSMATLLAVGDSMTLTFMVTQGATPYYPTAHQIDGSSVTPKWQGGTAPTAGNASGIDIYTYTVIKTAATPTYTVLASQTKFT